MMPPLAGGMEASKDTEGAAAALPFTPVIDEQEQVRRAASAAHSVTQLARELQELKPRIEDGPRWKLEPFLEAMDKLQDVRGSIGLQMAQLEGAERKSSRSSRLGALGLSGPNKDAQSAAGPGRPTHHRRPTNAAEVRRKQMEGTREALRQSAFPKSVSVGGTYATWGESSDEEGTSTEGNQEDPYASGSEEEDSWLEPREVRLQKQRDSLEELHKQAKDMTDVAVVQLLDEFRDALEKNSKILDSLSLKQELERRVATLHFQRASNSNDSSARPSTSHRGGGNFVRSASEAPVQKPTRHLLFDDPMLQEFLAETNAKKTSESGEEVGKSYLQGDTESSETEVSLRSRLTNSESMSFGVGQDESFSRGSSMSTNSRDYQGPGQPISPPSDPLQEQSDPSSNTVDSPISLENKSPGAFRHASGAPLPPRGGTPPLSNQQEQPPQQVSDLHHQRAASALPRMVPGMSQLDGRSESLSGELPEDDIPRASSRERRASDFIGGDLLGAAVLGSGPSWTPAAGGWLPSDAVPWLRKMAKRLSAAGAGDQCLEAYKKVRSAALLNSLKSMEMVELRTTALDAMPWPEMEGCMKGWIADLNIAAYILLDGERRLCEVVMGGLRMDWKGSLFSLLLDSRVHRAIVMLCLNLQCILRSRKSPEKLFWFLNILRVVEEATPMFEEVLLGTNKQKVLEEWRSLQQRISAAVLATLQEFKRMLREPIPAVQPPGSGSGGPGKPKRFFSAGRLLLNRVSSSDQNNTGQMGVDVTVHAVTSYVVNYILKLMERDAVFYDKLAKICGEQAGVPDPGEGPELSRTASEAEPRAATAGAGGRPSGAEEHNSSSKGNKSSAGGPKQGEQAPWRQAAEAGAAHSRTSDGQQGEGGSGGGPSPGDSQASLLDRAVEAEVSSLLIALEENIEARARSFQTANDFVGPALFCMNNAHYLSRCIDLCGPREAGKHVEWIKLMESNFEDAAVKKMAAALGYPVSSANLEVSEIRSKLRNFNTSFEELALDQRNWVITSDTHRRTLRTRLAKQVKQMYSFFLTPHRETLCEVSTYRWTPDGVERTILKTFFLNCGNPVPMSF